MAFELRRVTSKCYVLLFHGDDIGWVSYHKYDPEPWAAMLYRKKNRHPVLFPRPFVNREHRFETLDRLQNWLNGCHLPVSIHTLSARA